MRKIARITLGIAGLAGLLATTGVVPASAVGCNGWSCNGLGPVSQGCDADAFTAVNKRIETITIELRHSWACDASWVRISGGPNDRASVKNSDGFQVSKTLGSGGGTDWSAMVANVGSGMWAQACGKDILNNGFDAEGCTAKW
jgi:hypothetical protein